MVIRDLFGGRGPTMSRRRRRHQSQDLKYDMIEKLCDYVNRISQNDWRLSRQQSPL